MQYLKTFIRDKEKVAILVVGILVGVIISGVWAGMGF
jgi:hypothetical protein